MIPARTPIRKGTARRLGLRPPMSAGMFIFGRDLTDEQMDRVREICDRFAERMRLGDKLIIEVTRSCRWCEAGHKAPLSWWQRPLHWAGWWP